MIQGIRECILVVVQNRANGTNLFQFVSGSEWDEQRAGLNTTSCGRHGEKWGWERERVLVLPHLPGRQDGRGMATRNWRQFQHSWVHIACSCFFNYLGNAVGKRELHNKHIQPLFVLTCLTPLSLSALEYSFSWTLRLLYSGGRRKLWGHSLKRRSIVCAKFSMWRFKITVFCVV